MCAGEWGSGARWAGRGLPAAGACPGGERGRERRPGEPGRVRTPRLRPQRRAPRWGPEGGREAPAPAGRRGMTRLTPLAGWALPTAPPTWEGTTRSPGGPRESASGPAGRRGMASLTPLSLDSVDRLEARPRGACPGRTRESEGPELGVTGNSETPKGQMELNRRTSSQAGSEPVLKAS